MTENNKFTPKISHIELKKKKKTMWHRGTLTTSVWNVSSKHCYYYYYIELLVLLLAISLSHTHTRKSVLFATPILLAHEDIVIQMMTGIHYASSLNWHFSLLISARSPLCLEIGVKYFTQFCLCYKLSQDFIDIRSEREKWKGFLINWNQILYD